MPEGEIRFGVGATPNWDKFQTLTFSAGASQPGGRGAWNVHKEVSVEEARAFAAEIERWCVIVENDGKKDQFDPLGGASRGVGRCTCLAGPGTNPACLVHP